jgi:hypothetical protein
MVPRGALPMIGLPMLANLCTSADGAVTVSLTVCAQSHAGLNERAMATAAT